MKRVCFAILLSLAIGCGRNARRILPPLYEDYYPVVIGIRSFDQAYKPRVDSMLASILIESGFAAGILEEPFDNSMVDVVMVIDDVTISTRKSGLVPRCCVYQGEMSIALQHPDGSLIERYSAKTRIERTSLNPFAQCKDSKQLYVDLISTLIDEIDEDFQTREPEIVHTPEVDEKEFESEAALTYPTLSHISRNGIFAAARITGTVPLSTVSLNVNESDGEPLISQQLFYDRTRIKNGSRQWYYQLDLEEKPLPFSRELRYEIECIDAFGKQDVIAKGTVHTISGGMFRLKQAEVLTHGTIITAFGGLVIVMLLYSI